MDVRDLIRMVEGGWSPGSIDLLVADPPCTPWSRSGHRKGLDDERDMLRDTCTLIGLLRPRAYLIGNVPGLDEGPNWGVVQDVIGGMARHGYCVADFLRLDSANYGVPQRRVRPFWYGHMAGPCLAPPSPSHCDPAALATHMLPGLGLQPWATCRDALSHLPLVDRGRPVHQKRNPKHPASRPDEPSMTITTNGARHQGNCLEWPWDRPATTVHEDPRLAPPGHHDGSDRSKPNAIVLSEKAAAIIQGFPEDWHFAGATKKSRWAQIGMAMPPPLAEAVARCVRTQMESSRKEAP